MVFHFNFSIRYSVVLNPNTETRISKISFLSNKKSLKMQASCKNLKGNAEMEIQRTCDSASFGMYLHRFRIRGSTASDACLRLLGEIRPFDVLIAAHCLYQNSLFGCICSAANTQPVLEFFDFVTDVKAGQQAKCKLCPTNISRAQGSTNRTRMHLQCKHPEEVEGWDTLNLDTMAVTAILCCCDLGWS